MTDAQAKEGVPHVQPIGESEDDEHFLSSVAVADVDGEDRTPLKVKAVLVYMYMCVCSLYVCECVV